MELDYIFDNERLYLLQALY